MHIREMWDTTRLHGAVVRGQYFTLNVHSLSDGEEIERVSNFEYLSARIEANGKSTPEIRRRLAMATTRLTKMISIWKGQCKKNKTDSPRDSGIPNCLVWV